MGYSIAASTGRRLDALRHEGRDCRMALGGHGICRSRATIHVYYNRGGALQGCERHARIVLRAPVVQDHIGPLTVEKVERY